MKGNCFLNESTGITERQRWTLSPHDNRIRLLFFYFIFSGNSTFSLLFARYTNSRCLSRQKRRGEKVKKGMKKKEDEKKNWRKKRNLFLFEVERAGWRDERKGELHTWTTPHRSIEEMKQAIVTLQSLIFFNYIKLNIEGMKQAIFYSVRFMKYWRNYSSNSHFAEFNFFQLY